jgi:hypothetical protein
MRHERRSGARSGCDLKIKLATSVSITSLDVGLGGDVDVALLIDQAYEGLSLLDGARIDVAQQPVQ